MKTCMIGVGNELREDDGIGVEIVRNWIDSEEFDIYPVGERLFEIPQIIMNYARVIVIDAMPPENSPGKMTMWKLGRKIERIRKVYSLHDLDLIWQLQYGFQAGYQGETLLVGIEAHSFSYREGLSPELKRRLPDITAEIEAALRSKEMLKVGSPEGIPVMPD